MRSRNLIKSISVDFTSLSMWRSCPQKFSYRILQSLTGHATSDALDFGKLIHKGLELINEQNVTQVPEGVEHEIDYLAERNLPSTDSPGLLGVLNVVATEAATSSIFNIPSDGRRSLKHLLLLLARYVGHYANDSLRATHVEVKHKIHLGRTPNGVNVFYTGTCDGLTADAVLEHKTTSYLDTGFINKINPNHQATGYVVLARDFLGNPAINKVIFDAISTGGYGKSKDAKTCNPGAWTINKDPKKLFMRAETYRSDEQIAEWCEETLYDVDRMVEDIERGFFARNDSTCTAYNSTCEFIDICRANGSQREMLVNSTMQQALWDSFQVNRD